MTLKEKIQSVAEQGSDPEEAAAILKNSLSAAENGKVAPDLSQAQSIGKVQRHGCSPVAGAA